MEGCVFRVRSFLGPNVYPEAPDGGWGWLVALAFFLVEVFTYGTIKIFGIFLQCLMLEFNETNSRVSWIIAICVFVMTFTAPLSSVMTNRFGSRPVVMIGGLLIATGTIATGFTTSINQMYITTGVVAGLGYCLTFLSTLTILSQYFTRRRALVTAVASTGESFSMCALAPAFSALRDNIGWRHTMMVIGALQGSIIFCGALLRPIVIKPAAETDGSSQKEAEVLRTQENVEGTHSGTQENVEGTHSGDSQNISHSQDNELTGDSVDSKDSGVQSLKDTGERSHEEMALLHKEERLEAAQKAESKEPDEDGEKNKRDTGEGTRDKVEKEEADEILSTKNNKLLDFSMLREGSFVCYSLFGLFATLGFFAPPLYVIELSVSRGVARESATYMLSTMAVAEIFGRFSIGWVMSRERLRKKKLLVLLACIISMTLVLVLFTLVREFYGLAVCCALFGFFMGTISCTHIPMLAEDDVAGIQRMSSAAGVYVFIQSFAGLAGPPLGGLLVDMTQNYGSAFYSCAAGMALGSLFLGLVKSAKRGLPCRRRENSAEPSGEHGQGRRRDSLQDCLEVDVQSNHKQNGTAGKSQEVTGSA